MKLIVSMPTPVLSQIAKKYEILFNKLYESHSTAAPGQYLLSTDVTFCYDPNSFLDMYDMLRFIYQDAGFQKLQVVYSGISFEIADPALIKRMLSDMNLQNDPRIHRNCILRDMIRNRGITELQRLVTLADMPFTGIMHFDREDLRSMAQNPVSFDSAAGQGVVPQEIDEDYCDHITVSSRDIGYSLRIGKRNSVTFYNCIIRGDLNLCGVRRVEFENCIVTGKVMCVDFEKLQITNCNLAHLLSYNCSQASMQVMFSKVFRLELHHASFAEFDIIGSRIEDPYLTELKLPDTKIRMHQINYDSISPESIEKQQRRPDDSFFLTFLRDQKQQVSASETALDTIDLLLKNGEFDHDHHAMAELKYKKMLYSNSGFRKAFVILTGGYYKPSRWIYYIIGVSILFTILYCVIPDCFVSTIDGTVFTLNFWEALQFTAMQLIGANTMAISSVGAGQILTVLHASLNATVIANFFASIAKKYMGS